MFKKINLSVFLLGSVLTTSVMATTVQVDLYRGGNASSPRMDNVRDTDVLKYKNGNTEWVRAKQRGISTSGNTPSNQKNWWKVPKGTVVSNDIYIVNDHDDHWAWAPAKDMPLSDFIKLMQNTNSKFTKLK